MRGGETTREVIDEVDPGGRSAWASLRCGTKPVPGARCDADLPEAWLRCKRLYQVVLTAADPYVLGIGFAACATWRVLQACGWG